MDALFGRLCGAQHRHYIQAELVEWSYVDDRTQLPTTDLERMQTTRDETHLGTTFQKAIYVAYTDSTFSTRQPRSSGDTHLGLLGPLLHAVEGDRLVVQLRNALPFAASMHVRGLFLLSGNDSMPVPAAGGRRTFEWVVRDRSLATADDSVRSSTMHLYYSNTAKNHIDAGLVGAVLVTRAEFSRATSTPTPRDVDRELVIALQVVDEDASPLAATNYAQYATSSSAPTREWQNREWQNRKWAINGRIYNTLRGLNDTVRVDSRVRVHVAALGSDVVASMAGREVPLLSGETTSIDFVASRAGPLSFSSSAADHALRGLHANLDIAERITAPVAVPRPSAQERRFFLQTHDEQWSNESITLMCVYRAYTDENFTTQLTADYWSDGVVGPLLRLREGDSLLVKLHNNCSSNAGIQFAALTLIGDTIDDAAIPPGGRITLRYVVGNGAAGSYLYRSPTNETSLVGVYIVRDTNEAADNVTEVVVGGRLVDQWSTNIRRRGPTLHVATAQSSAYARFCAPQHWWLARGRRWLAGASSSAPWRRRCALRHARCAICRRSTLSHWRPADVGVVRNGEQRRRRISRGP
jgi:FtsP/CotA-like multicopper oxidase with cupredoxin domain